MADEGPILHLNTTPTWRGGEQQTLLLARAMATHRPTMIVGHADGVLLQRAKDEGIETAHVRSIGSLRSLVRRTNATLVHAHTSHAHQLARWSLLGSAVPLVVTRRVEYPLKRGLGNWFKYRHGVARFGAISNAVRDALVSGGVDEARIQVIPSAADMQAIDATAPLDVTSLQLPDGARTVLHAGALSSQKNQDMLLHAWSDIESRCPDAHLLIAGDGERKAELHALATSLGLHRVHWLGFRTDVIALMKACDVFVNSSRFEGLCSTLVQARRSGMCIVATRVGGVPEVVQHEVTGLLVELDDVSAMVDAVVRCLDNRDMEAIEAGVGEGLEGFSHLQMCSSYQDLYASIRVQ
jgi:glycosyltransferase involved in cell wall biosynthesis